MCRWLMTIILALGCVVQIAAQSVIGVAFYDVDAMYDTIPSSSYDDRDYTPQGRRAWGEERYRRKVEHTAAVIDSMGMDVVALYGVENEQVVRDIAMACKSDYTYLHREQNGSSGLDFALLRGAGCYASRVAPEVGHSRWLRPTARLRLGYSFGSGSCWRGVMWFWSVE